jgi:tetratricopeptide (TPR) repeat protein
VKSRSPERQLHDVEWAIGQGLGPKDLLPMLEKLVVEAKPGTAPALCARRHLSALVVEQNPWRAARLAREITVLVDDERAWAVLGLAHTLLGNYRSAMKAYRRALAIDPSCPSCQHNLGHLLDVVCGRPVDALRYLEAAHRAWPREAEVSASYAHALARAGRVGDARRLLQRSLGSDLDAVESWLRRWLDEGPDGTVRRREG